MWGKKFHKNRISREEITGKENRMTHYEKILNMSLEELAQLIVSLIDRKLQNKGKKTEKRCRERLGTQIKDS